LPQTGAVARRSRSKTALGLFWVHCLLVPFLPGMADCRVHSDPFGTLETRLVEDGFVLEMVSALFRRPEVTFDLSCAGVYFRHREGTVDYQQFTTPSSLARARDYMGRYRETLEEAEARYGVPMQIVTAILLVESRLGAITGSRRVFNTLSTLAALEEPGNVEHLWDVVRKDGSLSKKRVEAWAERKSRWAYAELKAYLNYTLRERIDPLEVSGSFAGAIGYAQFMPTSLLAYGQDGNGDGRIDLFDHSDAICSIAKYLKVHGWRGEMDPQKAASVLYQYNRSRYYVEALLQIAGGLGLAKE